MASYRETKALVILLVQGFLLECENLRRAHPRGGSGLAARPLSECLESVDSPEGRQRVARHLESLPFPRYEQSDTPGLLVRTTADGKRTIGRFVNRRFEPVTARARR